MESIKSEFSSRPYGWLEIVVSLFFILPVAQLMATLWQVYDKNGFVIGVKMYLVRTVSFEE